MNCICLGSGGDQIHLSENSENSEKDWTIVLRFEDYLDEQVAEWSVSQINYPEDQKKKLDLFREFASRGGTVILNNYCIDEKSNVIQLIGDPSPETWVSKIVQRVFINHKRFVDLFYSALTEEFGLEDANRFFSQELREKALRSGLSNNMIFDCLRTAAFQQIIDLQKNLAITESEEAKTRLKKLLEEMAIVLNNFPRATQKKDAIRSRNLCERIAQFTIQATDLTITSQNSVAWISRSLWFLHKLKVI